MRAQAVSAPVGSMAPLPSSMCWMRPSLSITNVARLANPRSTKSTPYSAATCRLAKSLNSGKRELELFGELFLGGNIVRADAKHLRLDAFKIGDTSLVRQHFLRSTTGKRRRKEGQDHSRLASEIGERHRLAGRGRQREIGRHVPHLQVGLGGLLGALVGRQGFPPRPRIQTVRDNIFIDPPSQS